MVQRVGQLSAGTRLEGRSVHHAQRQEFKRLFKRELGKLKFSAHAQKRIESREIKLAPGDLHRLEKATSLAAAKGARQALFLLDQLGFIVSVENRTVITALDRSQMQGSVFTDIDSTVIL